MTSTPAQTLVPPSGLITANPQPNGQPLFCLFTNDWLQLQGFIVQTLTLPITTGDFEAKYGTFIDEQAVKGCVGAMKSIQNLSITFGDPMSLMAELAKNPAVLQSATAPVPIYTHIVWFANQLYQTANSYNQTLAEFMTLLNPANCGSPAQCGAALKEILTGTGGLQSMATTMVTLANDLVKAMAGFSQQLAPSITTMNTYTANDSTFYADVTAAITTDISDVATFQSAADAAHKLWEDLTISAVTTSVGTLVLSGGLAWPLSATLAGALGAEAKKARDAYDAACAQVASAKADEQKKIQLKLDLNGFNRSMTPTNQAAIDFQKTLQQVVGIWTNISGNIAYIADNFTLEQLGTLSWVMQALDLAKATQDWQAIAAASQAYTSQSLVTYQIHPFGTPLPQQ